MELTDWIERSIPEPVPDAPYPFPEECGESLVDITDRPRLYYGAKYAEMGLSGALRRCYVRQTVAHMLQNVLDSLPSAYSLWIYDTLRPVAVQKSIYDLYWHQLEMAHPEADREQILRWMDDFVAYPRIDRQRPTPHSTGGAVDLTLCLHGEKLPMGTYFDDLTDRAHTRYYENRDDLSAQERRYRDNRRLLYHVMCDAGFVNYQNEWWHYAYGDRAWGHATGRTPIYGYMESPQNLKLD